MSAFTRHQRVLLAVVPPLTAAVVRLLGATLRYRDRCEPGTAAGHTMAGPGIFAFWHCSLLICAHRFRDLGIAILISRSFDGELIARTVERLGFVAIRGSSSRGGPLALKAMAASFRAGHLCAFTADGPRGPSRVAKGGPVQLAHLVAKQQGSAPQIGAFFARPARALQLGSWDGFLIPWPFTSVICSWPTHVVPELSALQGALDRAVIMATTS